MCLRPSKARDGSPSPCVFSRTSLSFELVSLSAYTSCSFASRRILRSPLSSPRLPPHLAVARLDHIGSTVLLGPVVAMTFVWVFARYLSSPDAAKVGSEEMIFAQDIVGIR